MRILQSFRGDQSGNIALIFAASMFGIVGTAGIAVDYGRASSARAELQGALELSHPGRRPPPGHQRARRH